MKKPITVTMLTLELYSEAVKPAALAAGILDIERRRDDWHEFDCYVTDAAAADEIAHCMYMAVMNYHHNMRGQFATLELQMIYQLEVSKEYHAATAEIIAKLYNAMTAIKNRETA